VTTDTRRICPSISGWARISACVVNADGASTLGSMPEANRAAIPATSALPARLSATRSARSARSARDGRSDGRAIARMLPARDPGKIVPAELRSA